MSCNTYLVLYLKLFDLEKICVQIEKSRKSKCKNNLNIFKIISCIESANIQIAKLLIFDENIKFSRMFVFEFQQKQNRLSTTGFASNFF